MVFPRNIYRKARPLRRAGLCALVLAMSSCQVLQQMAALQRPALEPRRVRIKGLSFEAADLALDVDVTNPNPVDVTLAGFDYDLRIEGATLVKGDQATRQIFAGGQRSALEIPLSLKFTDLAAAVKTLQKQDSAAYTVAFGFAFDVPVLGRIRVPAAVSGKLPVIRPPAVSIRSLRLKKMGLTRADLELALKVANPNGFAFGLKRIDYDFLVNGLPWARSASGDSMTVRAKSDGTIRIPVSLNLVEMGQTVVQILSGNRAMDCRLQGSLDLDASLPGFRRSSLPLDLAEKVDLTR